MEKLQGISRAVLEGAGMLILGAVLMRKSMLHEVQAMYNRCKISAMQFQSPGGTMKERERKREIQTCRRRVRG